MCVVGSGRAAAIHCAAHPIAVREALLLSVPAGLQLHAGTACAVLLQVFAKSFQLDLRFFAGVPDAVDTLLVCARGGSGWRHGGGGIRGHPRQARAQPLRCGWAPVCGWSHFERDGCGVAGRGVCKSAVRGSRVAAGHALALCGHVIAHEQLVALFQCGRGCCTAADADAAATCRLAAVWQRAVQQNL